MARAVECRAVDRDRPLITAAPPRPGEPLIPPAAGRLVSLVVLLALAVGGGAFLVSRGGGSHSAGASLPRLVRTAAVRRLSTARRAGTADSLTTAQLAGQRLIYSYAGLQPPPSLLAAIRAGEAAGVVFYGDNITSVAQIRAVVQQLQRVARTAPGHIPLLMITDQEGGDVRRLPGPPYAFPRSVGSSRNAVRAATDTGAAAARTLRAAGIDVNLAPVLDVARRAGNPISLYGRSYSSRAGVVATLGAAFIRAQQHGGVAAAAKHFPGLGTAGPGQDTDLRPVTLTASSTTLRAVDERPYRSAIAAGARLVMLSWARYPALDPGHVAGLSSRIINGELRGRLGFTGVTITDGIVAGGVTTSGDVATRTVAAAEAGEDLIVCAAGPDSPAVAAQAQAGLRRAIASGRISRAAARASVTRILALRAEP